MYIYSGLGQLPKSIGNIITYNDYKVMDPIIKHNLGNRIWPSILLPLLIGLLKNLKNFMCLKLL